MRRCPYGFSKRDDAISATLEDRTRTEGIHGRKKKTLLEKAARSNSELRMEQTALGLFTDDVDCIFSLRHTNHGNHQKDKSIFPCLNLREN